MFERFTDSLVRSANDGLEVRNHRPSLAELKHGAMVDVSFGRICSQRP